MQIYSSFPTYTINRKELSKSLNKSKDNSNLLMPQHNSISFTKTLDTPFVLPIIDYVTERKILNSRIKTFSLLFPELAQVFAKIRTLDDLFALINKTVEDNSLRRILEKAFSRVGNDNEKFLAQMWLGIGNKEQNLPEGFFSIKTMHNLLKEKGISALTIPVLGIHKNSGISKLKEILDENPINNNVINKYIVLADSISIETATRKAKSKSSNLSKMFTNNKLEKTGNLSKQSINPKSERLSIIFPKLKKTDDHNKYFNFLKTKDVSTRLSPEEMMQEAVSILSNPSELEKIEITATKPDELKEMRIKNKTEFREMLLGYYFGFNNMELMTKSELIRKINNKFSIRLNVKSFENLLDNQITLVNLNC